MRRSRSTGDGRQRGMGTALVGLCRLHPAHHDRPGVDTAHHRRWWRTASGRRRRASAACSSPVPGSPPSSACVGTSTSGPAGVPLPVRCVAAQALLVASRHRAGPPVRRRPHGDHLGALVGTSLVVGALVGLPQRAVRRRRQLRGRARHGVWWPRGTCWSSSRSARPSRAVTLALMVLLVATQLVTAAVVVGTRRLPLRTACLVAATALIVAAGLGLVAIGGGRSDVRRRRHHGARRRWSGLDRHGLVLRAGRPAS